MKNNYWISGLCICIFFICHFFVYTASVQLFFTMKFLKSEIYSLGKIRSIFNDPDLYQQWYLIKSNDNSDYLSHELDTVWIKGIKGNQVYIAFIGGGFEENHKDLNDNYIKNYSFNFLTNTNIIKNTLDNEQTMSVGLTSALSNNRECGVGSAPSSKFIILQIFDNDQYDIEDYQTSRAILYKIDKIHIFVINFVIDIYKRIKSYPGTATVGSLRSGVKYGRKGLGTIYIAGSGNQKLKGSNCAFNGFLQVPEVLTFGGISFNGSPTIYLERCNAILASSLTNEDVIGGNKIYSTAPGNTCKNSTGGVHATSSISAGIISLLISANPSLNVRQIMFLIIVTSIQYDHEAIPNSAGIYYSYDFGFGMLNAYKLIEASTIYEMQYIPDQHICATILFKTKYFIQKHFYKEIHIYSSGCMDYNHCVTKIEQVYIIFTLLVFHRNSITLYLTSPSGTVFEILTPRKFDTSTSGFHTWRLKLLGYFGEKPIGVWKLGVKTNYSSCRVTSLEFEFYGSCLNPETNVRSHQRVSSFICMHIYKKNPLYLQLCNLSSTIFNRNRYRDIFSFYEYEYPNIKILNNML